MRILYKLGGSLLDQAKLPQMLAGYLTGEARKYALLNMKYEPMLIVGGGPTADIVRVWDEVFKIGDESAHWLALKTLDLNAEFLQKIFINTELVTDYSSMAEIWERGMIPLLKPCEMVKNWEAKSSLKMPHHWDVTTDSVGLWLGALGEIERYVFLKSCDLNPEFRLNESAEIDSKFLTILGEKGFIDIYFSRMYAELSNKPVLEWVNFRNLDKL